MPKTFNKFLEEKKNNMDTCEMTISLFIRLLEYAREEIKDDKEIHVIAEKISKHGSKILAMEDYEGLVGKHK